MRGSEVVVVTSMVGGRMLEVTASGGVGTIVVVVVEKAITSKVEGGGVVVLAPLRILLRLRTGILRMLAANFDHLEKSKMSSHIDSSRFVPFLFSIKLGCLNEMAFSLVPVNFFF